MHELDYQRSLDCKQCGKECQVKYRRWTTRKRTNFYCCKDCEYKYKGLNRPIITECDECSIEIIKSHKDFNQSKKHFCSQSCSATYYNKLRPKKEKHSQNQPCPQCGELCWAKNGGVCKDCKNKNSYAEYSKLTLGDKTYDNHKYAKYSYVRYYAKRKAIELGWDRCSECGYDKHYEVAHIRPISDFPPETLLVDINAESNLKPLCPNCHWEFDNLKN